MKTRMSMLALVLLTAPVAGASALADDAESSFKATPLGGGTYAGHQGAVAIRLDESETKEIVTVLGDMPVGSNVGFHYHPGYAFVSVTKGSIASFDSAECPASQRYEAGSAFLDFPGHVHDIVNVGNEPAQFVVTFLLEEGEQPLHPADDPGVDNCHPPR